MNTRVPHTCTCKGRSHVCKELYGLQRWDCVRRLLYVWVYLGKPGNASLIGYIKRD